VVAIKFAGEVETGQLIYREKKYNITPSSRCPWEMHKTNSAAVTPTFAAADEGNHLKTS